MAFSIGGGLTGGLLGGPGGALLGGYAGDISNTLANLEDQVTGRNINQEIMDYVNQVYGGVNIGEFSPLRSQLIGQAGGLLSGSGGMTPEMQMLLQNTQQDLASARGSMLSYDPYEAAGQQYNLMRQMAAPQEALQESGLENRLFKRGVLGAASGTGSNPQLEAFYRAQATKDLGRQQQAFGQAQGVQSQLFNRYNTLANRVSGIDQQRFQQGLGLLGGAGNIGQLQLMEAQGRISPFIRGKESERDFTQSLFSGLFEGGLAALLGG